MQHSIRFHDSDCSAFCSLEAFLIAFWRDRRPPNTKNQKTKTKNTDTDSDEKSESWCRRMLLVGVRLCPSLFWPLDQCIMGQQTAVDKIQIQIRKFKKKKENTSAEAVFQLSHNWAIQRVHIKSIDRLWNWPTADDCEKWRQCLSRPGTHTPIK